MIETAGLGRSLSKITILWQNVGADRVPQLSRVSVPQLFTSPVCDVGWQEDLPPSPGPQAVTSVTLVFILTQQFLRQIVTCDHISSTSSTGSRSVKEL